MYRAISAVLGCLLLMACSRTSPIPTVPHVDLSRFMGDWYVIANIPTFLEKNAYNAVESYRLETDGTIQTTFTFRKGAFDGPLKTYRPTGFVVNTDTNAEWGMQFLWPIKAEYRIVYLTGDYQITVIGRSKRDYLWIMARTPTITDAAYDDVLKHVALLGYDTTEIQRVPQQPIESRAGSENHGVNQ